ncbi:hypothetical protein A5647_11205 [Mycobacterium sp. 1100029.7]|nr:hypothetical protein A5647_11205 [Mycobacterium sp. 1100029.7]
MADRLDVAGRLADGRAAVEHTQAYLRACAALGYQHPDLTSRPSQIRDWFDSEDGLNLFVLDGDCAQLRAAGAAAAEGLRIQQAQVGALTAAWTGAGSEAAVAFLQHHCDVAAMVATEMRAAAQRCESLRDNLWYLLDSKVETVIAIDDRSQAQRSSWLAAAAVVSAGAGERSTAEEVVRSQIMPFVDNDIRNDWVNAMRSSQVAFGTSYDMVNDRMAAAPAAHFECPGDLGPGFEPPSPSAPSAPFSPSAPGAPVVASVPAATAPAAVVPDVASGPPPAPPAASPPAPALSDLGPAMGDAAGMPMDSGGLGGFGGGSGGLGGLANRIVDALSGLLGSATDGLGESADENPLGDDSDEDPFVPDDDSDEDPFVPDDKPDAKPDAKADEVVKPKEEEAQPVAAGAPADAPPLPADESPPAPAAMPPPEATPAPAAAPEPPNDGSTPCEIAADQVPQAGQ